jgi:hypothetical protein
MKNLSQIISLDCPFEIKAGYIQAWANSIWPKAYKIHTLFEVILKFKSVCESKSVCEIN